MGCCELAIVNGTQIAKRILDRLTSFASNCNENCAATAASTTTTTTTATKRKTVARTFIDGIKQAFGKSNCRNEASIFSTSCTRERERKQAFGRSWAVLLVGPPRRPAEDEPITALDIFFIAYEERRGRPTVFATKINGKLPY